MKPEFRPLRAEEIEVRVGSVGPNGASLLLYKDARVDMSMLDEVVGPMNWKREHSRDNANCTVSIWDEEKQQWVSKEDTGTESNMEKEKGLASSSFKRSCTNWGIGRELYSAPFIWVDCETQPKNGYGYELVNRYQFKNCKVTEIEYDESRKIVALVITDIKTNTDIVRWAEGKKTPISHEKTPEEEKIIKDIKRINQNDETKKLSPSEQVAEELRKMDAGSREEMLLPVDERMVASLTDYANKMKVSMKRIIGAYGKATVRELNRAEYGNAIGLLVELADKREKNKKIVAKGA